ncbi:prenylated Rab acceptor protein 1-like [Amphiura filiformis]|uniref:prenylated Rab acceptor protein 1-like n=1 Tax=Amphiura filiformis TaxID=82378 RepID=UPI003B211B76
MADNITGNIEIPLDKMSLNSIQVSNPGIRSWIQKRRDNIRPWREFVSTARFTKPSSVATVGKRIVKNVEHFQTNYVFVFLGLAVYCLLTSPLLIIGLAVAFGACYFISVKNESRKLKVGGYELTLAQQYMAVACISLPLFFIAGATSAVFWVLGASFFFIMIHAAFYDPLTSEDGMEEADLEMEEVSFGK